MRGNELLDKMEYIDPAYVEAADVQPKKKKSVRILWGAAAACLCLAIGGVAAYLATKAKTPSQTQDTVNEAYGFHLNGDSTFPYFPISFEERQQYGLLPDDAIGLSKENTYTITKQDLGEKMGVAADCEDAALNGCSVYHFAKYPDKDSICIADTPDGYAFYVCSGLHVENEIGADFDVLLSAYGLPESLEKAELLTADARHMADVEDHAVMRSVLEILSGKTNGGLEANERRFAQAWHDAYGNDDVYYSEEDGCCRFREEHAGEKAAELWTKNERIIRITTERGYRLTIDYFPSVRSFVSGNGYYELSAADAEALNRLLEIPA